jgi:hypothetical protein
MSEKNQKFVLLTVGVLAMSILVGYLVFAWTEPSQNPPGGNVPPPVWLSPSVPEVDSSASPFSPSIWIKNTAGDDLLRLQAGDTVRLVVGNDGNVGIGTTTPEEKLDVQGGGVKVGNFKIKPVSGTELGVYDSDGNLIIIFDQGT